MNKIDIPKYSLAEELISSISHGIGALLGIAALVLSVVFSNKPVAIVSSAIYGASLIILYTISCLYHSFSPNIKAKKVFRVLDHDSIYLLIFGTYMPYLLVTLGGSKGWILWGIMYTIGALFYKIGKKVKYMHSLFHFFVLAGSIFHFSSIFLYVIR